MAVEQNSGTDPKVVGIVAYITLIGWIVALVLNSSNKSEFGSFHIRQMLGIMLMGLVLSFIPIVGWILNIVVLILWIIGLISAVQGQMKPVPVVGQYFQDWFKSL